MMQFPGLLGGPFSPSSYGSPSSFFGAMQGLGNTYGGMSAQQMGPRFQGFSPFGGSSPLGLTQLNLAAQSAGTLPAMFNPFGPQQFSSFLGGLRQGTAPTPTAAQPQAMMPGFSASYQNAPVIGENGLLQYAGNIYNPGG